MLLYVNEILYKIYLTVTEFDSDTPSACLYYKRNIEGREISVGIHLIDLQKEETNPS